MAQGIGIFITERIALGLVENNQLVGPMLLDPEDEDQTDTLRGMPAEAIGEGLRAG